MRDFLRSVPGWFALIVVEWAALFVIARVLVAAGMRGRAAFGVVIALAVALVAVNYLLRRRYLSGP